MRADVVTPLQPDPTDQCLGTAATRGRCIVVMGVSASGKSSIAKALAHMLPGWEFADADPFHPVDNWAKIEQGVGLEDDERAVFVGRLLEFVRERQASGSNFILSWSALRFEHREMVRDILPKAHFCFIEIDFDTALDRSLKRKAANPREPGPGIVLSQYDTLQTPSEDEALRLLGRDAIVRNTFRILRTYVEEGFIFPEEIGVSRP